MPFKSPLNKGGFKGVVFFLGFPVPRFHEDKILQPPMSPLTKGDMGVVPFSKGDSLCHTLYDPLK
jgi:hypothetical protein